ncbi:MAG: hypothetical protein IJO73_02420 [Clostridia bacterium]|nr:hypothetical protein [Clostridia bacterium]
MNGNDILAELKNKVREELQNEAEMLSEKIIDELVSEFRTQLVKEKNSIISGILNGLHFSLRQELGTNNITILINMHTERKSEGEVRE